MHSENLRGENLLPQLGISNVCSAAIGPVLESKQTPSKRHSPNHSSSKKQECILSSVEEEATIESAKKAVIIKLMWATKELESSSSIEYSNQLCQLIQSLCAALKLLKSLD